MVALFVISSLPCRQRLEKLFDFSAFLLYYVSLFRNVNLIAEIFDTPQKTGKVLMCDKIAEIETFSPTGHIDS